MLELDRLNNKIIMLRQEFKNYPNKKQELLNEITEKEKYYKSELEHYEDQKLEISYLKEEISELKEEFEKLKSRLETDDSLQKEFDELKKNLLLKEEELLLNETLLNDTVEVVNEAKNVFETVKEENEKELERLKQKEKEYNNEIKEIENKKEELFQELAQIDTNVDLVKLYKEINEAFPGGVVSKVENDSCSRCFMQITPQILNEIYREAIPEKRKNEIITCPSCKCILYIDPIDIED